MLVTPDQIRAGRALINWSQADLAEHSDLARPTIVNIETGVQVPEFKTLEKIVYAFEKADVQFGVNESVRRKDEDVKIYRGKDEFLKFFDELHEYVQAFGGPILASNTDERDWANVKSDFFVSAYAKSMTAIREKADLRILIKQGDNYMPASPYATYRWVREEDFATVPFHVYANRLSIFLFLDEPVIISVRDQDAADTYKEQFLNQWKNALPVDRGC